MVNIVTVLSNAYRGNYGLALVKSSKTGKMDLKECVNASSFVVYSALILQKWRKVPSGLRCDYLINANFNSWEIEVLISPSGSKANDTGAEASSLVKYSRDPEHISLISHLIVRSLVALDYVCEQYGKSHDLGECQTQDSSPEARFLSHSDLARSNTHAPEGT